MPSTTLTPPSSINDLRTQAHLLLSARLQALDLTPLLVMTIGSNLPDSILPYLIWQFDMMVPSAPMQALGITALQIIQNALPLHSLMGTPAAIKNALALCGYSGVTLEEGQASWGGSSYPASQGWAVFRVNMGATAPGVLYSQQAAGVTDGENQAFTLPGIPQPTSDARIFYNGILQDPSTGYTISGTSLAMSFAPALNSALGVALRSAPLSATVLGYLAQIINFFKPARSYLDEIYSGYYPEFFDAVVPTVSGGTLVLPESPTTLELYRNGLYQVPGVDYTLSGATATPRIAPGADRFLAFGSYGSTATATEFADWIAPTSTSNPLVFTLPESPSPAGSLKLYGGYQLLTEGLDYELSAASITYNVAPSGPQWAFYRY